MATPFMFETVDDSGLVHGELSLALDKNGNSRVAYAQQVSGQIMVAQRDCGVWAREVPGGSVGEGDRICLAGNPQLA